MIKQGWQGGATRRRAFFTSTQICNNVSVTGAMLDYWYFGKGNARVGRLQKKDQEVGESIQLWRLFSCGRFCILKTTGLRVGI